MTTPDAIHAAEQSLQTILKAVVVGARVQDPASRPGGEDSAAAFTAAGALQPPYDPEAMCLLFEHSNSLRPNVDSYATNIDGFGYRFEPTIDFDAEDAREKVADTLTLERLAARDAGTLPDGMPIDPSADEIPRRLTELRQLARGEGAPRCILRFRLLRPLVRRSAPPHAAGPRGHGQRLLGGVAGWQGRPRPARLRAVVHGAASAVLLGSIAALLVWAVAAEVPLYTTSLEARVVAFGDSVAIESPVEGRVAEVRVAGGDDVEAGDVLVLLDGSAIESRRDHVKKEIAFLRSLVADVQAEIDSVEAIAATMQQASQASIQEALTERRRQLSERAQARRDSLRAARLARGGWWPRRRRSGRPDRRGRRARPASGPGRRLPGAGGGGRARAPAGLGGGALDPAPPGRGAGAAG